MHELKSSPLLALMSTIMMAAFVYIITNNLALIFKHQEELNWPTVALVEAPSEIYTKYDKRTKLETILSTNQSIRKIENLTSDVISGMDSDLVPIPVIIKINCAKDFDFQNLQDELREVSNEVILHNIASPTNVGNTFLKISKILLSFFCLVVIAFAQTLAHRTNIQRLAALRAPDIYICKQYALAEWHNIVAQLFVNTSIAVHVMISNHLSLLYSMKCAMSLIGLLLCYQLFIVLCIKLHTTQRSLT